MHRSVPQLLRMNFMAACLADHAILLIHHIEHLAMHILRLRVELFRRGVRLYKPGKLHPLPQRKRITAHRLHRANCCAQRRPVEPMRSQHIA